MPICDSLTSLEHWQDILDRWLAAGLVDADAARAIVAFEQRRESPGAGRLEWPVLIALAFGGIALGAGMLLLVASHWESFGPNVRFSMVIAMVVLLHLGGIVAADSPRFRSAFHLLGSISFGAGIFLTRQIFQIQEGWEHAMTLWTLGTCASWWLLRDTPQTILLAVLAPMAIGAEYTALYSGSLWPSGWGTEWAAIIAIDYLSAVYPEKESTDRRALLWVGAIAVLPASLLLGGQWWREPTPLSASAFAALSGIVVAWFLRGRDFWVNGLFCLWVFLVAAIPRDSTGQQVPALLYGLYVLGSAGLVWWGLQENRPERVNFGIAGFALTVICFYISNVFDRVGRSASLIGLGILLLAGGWLLERTRRNLIAGLPT